MIQPTTKNSNKIMAVLLRLGFQPWDYPTDVAWQKVADLYNYENPNDQLSSEAIRARYRRIMAWLDENDYSPEEYVEAVLYESGEFYIEESIEDIDNLSSEIKNEIKHSEEQELISTGMLAETPEDLLRAAGLDPRFYETDRGKISHWGNRANPNWSISANFKRREVPDDEVLEYIAEALNAVEPPPYTLEAKSVDPDGVLCVMSMYDLHLEKAELEGGFEQKVLEYHRAVLDLAGRVRNVAQFVVPIGNDFGNFDNIQGSTTAGTPQDNTVYWQRAIDMRVKLTTWTIETLSEVAPVHVIFVPGNHDRYSNYWLGKAIELRYDGDIRITCDNQHGTRKYFLWNQIGLMFTHGSEEKYKDLPMIFATEGGHVFGAATHREIHTGHRHNLEVFEEFGVISRKLPSLSGPDSWHNEKGYVGNSRAAMALTYTKNRLESEIMAYV